MTAAQGDYTPSQIGTAAQGLELLGLSNLSTTGLVQRTGAGTYTTVSGISSVLSVFGRSGNVVAQQGDYRPDQIGTAAQGAELSGISNITGTGFVERTDLGAYITVANGIPPFGPAGGDLAGNYPNPVLVATNVTPGTYNGGKGFAFIITYF